MPSHYPGRARPVSTRTTSPERAVPGLRGPDYSGLTEHGLSTRTRACAVGTSRCPRPAGSWGHREVTASLPQPTRGARIATVTHATLAHGAGTGIGACRIESSRRSWAITALGARPVRSYAPPRRAISRSIDRHPHWHRPVGSSARDTQRTPRHRRSNTSGGPRPCAASTVHRDGCRGLGPPAGRPGAWIDLSRRRDRCRTSPGATG